MKKHITQKRLLKRWERQDDGRNGYSSIPCRVDISIDFEAMADALGHKALRNKTLSTKLMCGIISVKVAPEPARIYEVGGRLSSPNHSGEE